MVKKKNLVPGLTDSSVRCLSDAGLLCSLNGSAERLTSERKPLEVFVFFPCTLEAVWCFICQTLMSSLPCPQPPSSSKPWLVRSSLHFKSIILFFLFFSKPSSHLKLNSPARATIDRRFPSNTWSCNHSTKQGPRDLKSQLQQRMTWNQCLRVAPTLKMQHVTRSPSVG